MIATARARAASVGPGLVRRCAEVIAVASLAVTMGGAGLARSPEAAADSAEGPRQRAVDAVAAIDRIGDQFRVLDARVFADLALGDDDPQAAYLATGAPDARMELWLVTARKLAAEVSRLRDAPYRRHIDPEDGVAVGQIHLAPMRSAAHSLAVLVQDAAIRGDREAMLSALESQAMLVLHAASESTLASTLASISIAETHLRSVGELIERGAVDKGSAARIIALRDAFAEIPDFGAVAAAELEARAIEAEMDRLFRTPLDERGAATAALRIPSSMRLEDNAVLTARHTAGVYLGELAAIVANGDGLGRTEPDDLRAKAVDLENRLSLGEFGEILKALAPPALPVFDGVRRVHAGVVLQEEVLRAIEGGTMPPTAHADAAHYLMRAARAAAGMPVRDQQAIHEAATLGARAPANTIGMARQAIDAVRDDLIAPLLAASACGRCTMPTRPESASGGGLVRAASIGINGAIRIMLSDAIIGGDRRADAASAAESIAAALRIAAHLADAGNYAHALASQEAVRDAHLVLAHILADGQLDADGARSISSALERLEPADPFGFHAAFTRECAWIGSRTFTEGSSAVTAFDLRRLETLRPNEIAYLLAMFTPEAGRPVGATRSRALDGVLVDIRPWFHLEAFSRAVAERETLRARALRDAGKRSPSGTPPTASAIDDSPLAWLDVTVPIDIERRIDEAAGDLDALKRLLPRPAKPAAAAAASPNASGFLDRLARAVAERLAGRFGPGHRSRLADAEPDALRDAAREE